MPTIKEYNQKLKSLKNTQKITKTMKMVSASKLRKAQQAQANAKLYAQNLTALASRISAAVDSSLHPLLQARPVVRKVLVLVITSDKGLCGAFNHNANRQVQQWVAENRSRLERIDLSFCGKKGYQYFQHRQSVRHYYENVTLNPKFLNAQKIGDDIQNDFLSGQYDEVYLVYNQFFSPLLQKTIFEKILPLDPQLLLKEKAPGMRADYLFEPPAEELLEFLIPHYLYFKIYFGLLENSAGEHGARMSAMDSATKNASKMSNTYTLYRNRARQAQITTELIEIVAGKEALN